MLAALVLLLAAGQVSNEIIAGTSGLTQENVRSGSLANALNGSLDVTDTVTLSLGAQLTLDRLPPRPAGATFSAEAAPIWLLLAGADVDLGEHLSLGLTLDAAPPTTQRSPSVLTVQLTPRVDAFVNTLVRTTSSSGSIGGWLAWDSAGLSDLEWSVLGSVTAQRFRNEQSLEKIERAADGAVVSRGQLQAWCDAGAKACTRVVRAALEDRAFALDSVRLAALGALTIALDTDVTLGADVWLYRQDPTDLGYFSISASSRVSGGAGVPIAPLRFLVRADVQHRFGAFSLRLGLAGGRYAGATADTTGTLSLRAQYRFNRSFRIWATLAGSRDEDAAEQSIDSAVHDPDGRIVGGLTASLGGAWKF